MKKYKCHKIVEAMKIADIRTYDDKTADLVPETGSGEGSHIVGQPWIQKHDPKVGGYYVRYEDGYTSYSPAEAFEAGYTPIEDD